MENAINHRFSTLIFDFDGTLVDSFSVGLECVNLLAEKYNYIPLKDTIEQRNRSMKQAIKYDLKLPWYKIGAYKKDIKILYKQRINNVRIFPEFADILRPLAESHLLGIVTSNTADIVNTVLKKHDLDVFEFIFSDSSLFRKHKVFQKLLKSRGIDKEKTLYFGDEVRDIVSCKKINLPVAAVTWGFNGKTALEKAKPDFIFDNPRELSGFLENDN